MHMKRYRLSHDEISALCLELSLLHRAGADCAHSLSMLAEDAENARLSAFFTELSGYMDAGSPLSEAMEKSGAFPKRVYTMLRVGERVGRSEEALRAISLYHGHLHKTDLRIRSVLLYPSILLLVMLTVVVVLLTQVLPIFNEVYASLGGEMTGVAGVLLHAGETLNGILPLLTVLLAIGVIFVVLFAFSTEVRGALLRFWKRIRKGKGLSYKSDLAAFANALSMAINSGLTIDEALSVAGEVLDDRSLVKHRLALCRKHMKEGGSLAVGIRDSELFDPTVCRLIELGVKSGNIETVMEETARRLDGESEELEERLLGRVEPTLVVIASLLVGMILLSVMLPLTQIMTAIG